MKKIPREVVELLKKNNKYFGNLSPIIQKVFERIGKENCVYLDYMHEWAAADSTTRYYFDTVYRIRKNYQLPKTTFEFCNTEITLGKKLTLKMLDTTTAPIRIFSSGATCDTDKDKLDFEGFFSPVALVEYARYMHKHRLQPDGKLRDSDNWQKGIPEKELVKSLIRHIMDVWLLYRDYKGVATQDKREAICGTIFNAMALLHEQVKDSET
jgi:hypothetical protein